MPTWEDGERCITLISQGICPICRVTMKILPRTILGCKADPGHRWAYDNYDCEPCGLKFSWLVKDPIPAGLA